MKERANSKSRRVSKRSGGSFSRRGSDSDHKFNFAPNPRDRDFAAAGPNQKWADDIGHIWTCEDWLYLALAIILEPMADNGSLPDLHSQRVIALRDLHANPFRVAAWAVSNHMKRDLAIRALKMAIAMRSLPRGCIFHSDRPSHDLQANRCRATGSQYCSHDYQKVLREHGFKASMSGKGNCYDRAMGIIGSSPMARAAVETFFKTLKAELILRRTWETRRQAETAVF